MLQKNKLILLISLISLGFTSSCSLFSSDDNDDDIKDENLGKTDEQIYSEAKSLMNNGAYSKAAEVFSEIERLYPFSQLANKAKVMTAYAHYKDEEYDKAIDAIDAFINFNPGNEEVMFMYYLKAICYYDRISDTKRDQDITDKARQAFEELANRFPDSKYARDAKYKLDLIRDHLAGKQMEIGRYYLKTNKPLAAINRFKDVVKNYDNTSQIEEALYRLVETNLILGFDEESVRYASVLGHNYSNGRWYKKAYKLLNDEEKVGSKQFLKTITSKMKDDLNSINNQNSISKKEDKQNTEQIIKDAVE